MQSISKSDSRSEFFFFLKAIAILDNRIEWLSFIASTSNPTLSPNFLHSIRRNYTIYFAARDLSERRTHNKRIYNLLKPPHDPNWISSDVVSARLQLWM